MNKRLAGFLILIVLFSAGKAVAWGKGQTGTLEITGVPIETTAGRYDRQSGVFVADVSEITGALISVEFEEVKIVGQQMEWRTEDNYLIFSVAAKLTKDDFELTADVVEYFGDEKKLKAAGNVVVVTDDSTVYADHLDYDENTDEALFTGTVRVVFSDGVLEGERFLMLLEKSELQFFGSFQGEFNEESNK